MPLTDPALGYFLDVFECGSVNLAARRSYVAPSAISRHISRLENEVGVPLFERTSTGMVPTEAAHAFAGFARRAIQDATQVLDEIHERPASPTVLSLATSAGIGHDFVPRVIATYGRRRPEVRFALQLEAPATATQMVRDGTADLAVTFSLTLESGVSILYSCEAALHAVMRRGHPLAGASSLGLADLTAYPLAASFATNTNRFLLDAAGVSHGLRIEPAFVCNNPDALMRYVQLTDAVCVLSRITLGDEAYEELTAVPLDEKEFGQRTLQVQSRAVRSLPPPVSDFAETLIEALDRHEI